MKTIAICALAAILAIGPPSCYCQTVARQENVRESPSHPGWLELRDDAPTVAILECRLDISRERSAKAGVSVLDILLAQMCHPLKSEYTITGDYMDTVVAVVKSKIGFRAVRLRDVADVEVVVKRTITSDDGDAVGVPSIGARCVPAPGVVFRIRKGSNSTGVTDMAVARAVGLVTVGKSFSLNDLLNAQTKTKDNHDVRLGQVAEFDLLVKSRSIPECDKAIKSNPRDAFAFADRGFAYAIEGKPGKAILDCNESIQLAPKHPSIYVLRGQIYECNSDKSRAHADFLKAKALINDSMPEFPEAGIPSGVPGTHNLIPHNQLEWPHP